MTTKAADPKAWRDASEEPGVGMLDDGKLNVVTPEQYRQRVIERNADEAADSHEVDDLSELYAANLDADSISEEK